MGQTLNPNQVILIDEILNSSTHYGTQELYELMVDMIHLGITPDRPVFINYKYLKPQFDKHLQENRQSVFLTELITEFDISFVRPWFESNFKKFHKWFTKEETTLWSTEYICSYSEFKFNLIEVYTDSLDEFYTYSFLDKQFRDTVQTTEK